MAKRRQALNLFLDSSVLFSATNSPTGGSSKLFTLPNLKLHASRVVLHEVEKNVRLKLRNYHIDRFFMLTSRLEIVDQEPNDKLIGKSEKVIAKKDSVILAEFKKSKCDFLITLDKKDFLQDKVKDFIKPKIIFTPKMFFTTRA